MTQLAMFARRDPMAEALAELVVQVTAEVGTTKKLRAFCAFHAQNPHVYRMLEKFTLEAAARRKHFGVRVVYERLRWYYAFETTDHTDFKLNDHYHSLYARLFMLHHREYEGLFELRKLQPEG